MKSDITVVLDRSGSMASIASDMVGGLKQLVEDQKKIEGQCTFTLAQFDTQYEIVIDARPIAEVDNIELRPRGGTALLDALGQTITRTGERFAAMDASDRPDAVTFVIITDGEENSSREFTLDAVKAMIKLQEEKYNWDFVYLGANQDAIAVGSGLGLVGAKSFNYAANEQGVRSSYNTLSGKIGAMRTGQTQQVGKLDDFTAEERAEAAK